MEQESTSESESKFDSYDFLPATIPEPSYMKNDLPEMDFRRFSSDYFPGMSTQENSPDYSYRHRLRGRIPDPLRCAV